VIGACGGIMMYVEQVDTRSMKMFGKISIDRDVLNGDQTRSHEKRKTDICL
jgi:hypothetical protein